MKAGAIHWSIGPGPDLHGFMAVPDAARGKQPAVLLIGGPETSGENLRDMTFAAAQAGFVACAPTPARSTALVADMRGTAQWLAANRYATGRVAAIGLGTGTPVALALAREQAIAAAILFGPVDPPLSIPTLALIPSGDDRWLAPGDAVQWFPRLDGNVDPS